jgi:hypothetical protein
MISSLRLAGQFAVIFALFAVVSSFAAWPVYRQTPRGSAVLVLTFVHNAARKGECRRLTPQEIAKLPPNMRRVRDCPRERLPVYVEFDIDGRNIYRASLAPTGIAGDGPSRVYQRFAVPAGEHSIAVRMRDSARTAGFDHERQGRVSLAPDQMFVVDFRSEPGEFVFR